MYMEKQPKPIILEGLQIDGMAALQEQLLKVLHVNAADIRPEHFADDLLWYLDQMPDRPRELVWNDHWFSCRKMRHTLVPVQFDYIVLGPGHSNMMNDAVNAKAEIQAAQHWEASTEPLKKLLKEIDVLFGQLGLKATYLE